MAMDDPNTWELIAGVVAKIGPSKDLGTHNYFHLKGLLLGMPTFREAIGSLGLLRKRKSLSQLPSKPMRIALIIHSGSQSQNKKQTSNQTK